MLNTLPKGAAEEMYRLLDNQRHSDAMFDKHHTLIEDPAALTRLAGRAASSRYGTGGGRRRRPEPDLA